MKVKGGDFLSKLSQQFSETKPKGQDAAMQYSLLPVYRQGGDMSGEITGPGGTSPNPSESMTQSPSKAKLQPAPKVNNEQPLNREKRSTGDCSGRSQAEHGHRANQLYKHITRQGQG